VKDVKEEPKQNLKKPGFWAGVLNAIGKAIGEAKFNQ